MAVRSPVADQETSTLSVRLPKSLVNRFKEWAASIDVNLNTFVAASFVWGNLPDGCKLTDCLADFEHVIGEGPLTRVVLKTWPCENRAVLDERCQRLTEAGLIENYAAKESQGQVITTLSLTIPGLFVAKHYLGMQTDG